MTILPDEHLERRSTGSLLHILRCTNAVISTYYCYHGYRCCEICQEFLGSNEQWEKEVTAPVRAYEEYKKVLKRILAKREHMEPKRGRSC